MTAKRLGKVVNGIATFNDEEKVMNRTTVESNIPIPDLWHVVQRMGFDTEDGKAVLETWHLAHELRKSIVHIDRLIVSLREAKRE
tara:strand:+ start:329 stop:583 length:255 start_codon:yes stop_codon:yes gene_type:complete